MLCTKWPPYYGITSLFMTSRLSMKQLYSRVFSLLHSAIQVLIFFPNSQKRDPRNIKSNWYGLKTKHLKPKILFKTQLPLLTLFYRGKQCPLISQVHSLFCNLLEVYSLKLTALSLTSIKPHIICTVEMWLDESILDSELCILVIMILLD